MIAKQIIRSVLLIVVLGSLAIWANREFRKSKSYAEADKQPAPAETLPVVDGPQVVMTYFLIGTRCESCRKIEALARETAEKDFPAELASKKLVFRVIDTGEAANRHYLKDYQLTSKTVVISRRVGRQGNRLEGHDESLGSLRRAGSLPRLSRRANPRIPRLMSLSAMLGTALWLGLLTSISPCPLATNLAATAYLARRVESRRRAVTGAVAYTLGRVGRLCGHRRAARAGRRLRPRRFAKSPALDGSAVRPGARAHGDGAAGIDRVAVPIVPRHPGPRGETGGRAVCWESSLSVSFSRCRSARYRPPCFSAA